MSPGPGTAPGPSPLTTPVSQRQHVHPPGPSFSWKSQELTPLGGDLSQWEVRVRGQIPNLLMWCHSDPTGQRTQRSSAPQSTWSSSLTPTSSPHFPPDTSRVLLPSLSQGQLTGSQPEAWVLCKAAHPGPTDRSGRRGRTQRLAIGG